MTILGVREGCLVRVDDHRGFAQLAHVFVVYRDRDWRLATEGRELNQFDGYYVSHFSDHPGNFVPAHQATDATPDLLRELWYLPPLMDRLIALLGSLPAQTAETLESRLPELQIARTDTVVSGDHFTSSGVWTRRGTNDSRVFEEGDKAPEYNFFEELPNQWFPCHWDLPSAGPSS
ncbi:MAG: hypothetical protein ACT4OM_10525 [Actinomycetota bacterium]